MVFIILILLVLLRHIMSEKYYSVFLLCIVLKFTAQLVGMFFSILIYMVICILKYLYQKQQKNLFFFSCKHLKRYTMEKKV